MSHLHAVLGRLQAATLAGLLSLPTPVKRRLAGPPVVEEGAALDVETQLVLRVQALLREPPAEGLPIEKGRLALERQSALVAGRLPIGAVSDVDLGGVGARVYVPKALLGTSDRPTLVFLHGGGFIYGAGHGTHDAPCRLLAERSGVQVISVDYRLAPEHPFPAAYDDCRSAYRYVVEHATELAVDVDRLAVGGDSAGGNLAIGVAELAAREGLPLAYQVLVYPVTDSANTSESRRRFGRGYFLTTEFMQLATESYVRPPEEVKDPRVSPLLGEVPDALAPALVVTAGFDPLRDEGEAWARRLAEAGVDVELRREPGLIHGFFNWVGVGSTAREAVRRIGDDLRAALAR